MPIILMVFKLLRVRHIYFTDNYWNVKLSMIL